MLIKLLNIKLSILLLLLLHGQNKIKNFIKENASFWYFNRDIPGILLIETSTKFTFLNLNLKFFEQQNTLSINE